MTNELVHFLKTAFVEQEMDALPRGELARFMLAFPAFGASSGFRFGGQLAQLVHAVVMFAGRSSGRWVRQAVLQVQVSWQQRCARQGEWRARRFQAAEQRQEPFPRRWRK